MRKKYIQKKLWTFDFFKLYYYVTFTVHFLSFSKSLFPFNDNFPENCLVCEIERHFNEKKSLTSSIQPNPTPTIPFWKMSERRISKLFLDDKFIFYLASLWSAEVQSQIWYHGCIQRQSFLMTHYIVGSGNLIVIIVKHQNHKVK